MRFDFRKIRDRAMYFYAANGGGTTPGGVANALLTKDGKQLTTKSGDVITKK